MYTFTHIFMKMHTNNEENTAELLSMTQKE